MEATYGGAPTKRRSCEKTALFLLTAGVLLENLPNSSITTTCLRVMRDRHEIGQHAQCTDENSVKCFPSDTCRVCRGRVNDNGACVDRHNEAVVSNVASVACDDGLVLQNGEGVTLSPLFTTCIKEAAERCLACDGGVVDCDDSSLQCTVLATGGRECRSNKFFDGVQCSSCGDHCPICDGGVCIVCDDGFTIVDSQSVAFAHPIAQATAEGTITNCADGFFIKDRACLECGECATCFNTTTCLSCGSGSDHLWVNVRERDGDKPEVQFACPWEGRVCDGCITIPQPNNSATFSSDTILAFLFSSFLDLLTPGNFSRSRAFHHVPYSC